MPDSSLETGTDNPRSTIETDFEVALASYCQTRTDEDLSTVISLAQKAASQDSPHAHLMISFLIGKECMTTPHNSLKQKLASILEKTFFGPENRGRLGNPFVTYNMGLLFEHMAQCVGFEERRIGYLSSAIIYYSRADSYASGPNSQFKELCQGAWIRAVDLANPDRATTPPRDRPQISPRDLARPPGLPAPLLHC